MAAGATGKSAGLLARWADPPGAGLVQLSFDCHASLAAEHRGVERWGYRRVTCADVSFIVRRSRPSRWVESGSESDVAVAAGLPAAAAKQSVHPGRPAGAPSPLPDDLDWLDPDTVQSYRVAGPPQSAESAQVHPYQFTRAIAALAREAGVEIREGAQVTKVATAGSGNGVVAVEYRDLATGHESFIKSPTDVIVAAGPWTGTLMPATMINGLRAHSLILEANISPYVVFTSIRLPDDFAPAHRSANGSPRRYDAIVDPEIYSRPHDEAFISGVFCFVCWQFASLKYCGFL